MKVHPYSGTFVMTDGPDGAGKSVVLDTIIKFEEKNGRNVFDTQDCCEVEDHYPGIEILEKYKTIITHEPSYCAIGKGIRDELIAKNDRNYSAPAIAEAYSLDRALQYQRTVLPALMAGINVIQSRSISASLAYQPTMNSPEKLLFGDFIDYISFEEVLDLRGNKFVSDFLPNLFLITLVDDEKILKDRWEERLEKIGVDDNAIFENLEFQRELIKKYTKGPIHKFFKEGGTKVVIIDTSTTVESTRNQVLDAYCNLLSSRFE